MVDHLFEGFLSDIKKYDMAIAFWRDQCSQILRKHAIESFWMESPPIRFINGTLDRGDNLYGLHSDEHRAALRIILHEPESSEVVICAWMDTQGDVEYDNDKEALVISCEPSEQAVKIAIKVIEPWVTRQKTYDEMQLLIKEKCPPR